MVSHKISVESIEEVSAVLRRAPVIWDNIHANDYDPQRLFLGPYKVKISCAAVSIRKEGEKTDLNLCVRTVPLS